MSPFYVFSGGVIFFLTKTSLIQCISLILVHLICISIDEYLIDVNLDMRQTPVPSKINP